MTWPLLHGVCYWPRGLILNRKEGYRLCYNETRLTVCLVFVTATHGSQFMSKVMMGEKRQKSRVFTEPSWRSYSLSSKLKDTAGYTNILQKKQNKTKKKTLQQTNKNKNKQNKNICKVINTDPEKFRNLLLLRVSHVTTVITGC